MPRVSGTMQLTDGVRSGLDVCAQQSAAGVDVTSDLFDAMLSDIAREITNSIAADGSTVVQDDVDWGGNKITNLANGTAATDAPTLAQVDKASPIGEVKIWLTGTIPQNHFELNGQLLSRTLYNTLWTLWGPSGSNICGAGDGSTTFTLPDWRGRMPFGQSASGTGSTLGSTFGSVDHTHYIDHSHDSGTLYTPFEQYSNYAKTKLTLNWSNPIPDTWTADGSVTTSAGNLNINTPITGTVHAHGMVVQGRTDVYSGYSGGSNPPCFVCKFIVRAL